MVKLVLLGLALWMAQRAWSKWVNGPEVTPSSEPWPPVGGQDSKLGGAEPAPSQPTAATAPPAAEAQSAPAHDASPAKRAAKKAAPAKTAPGKIVAANQVRTPAKKAGRGATAPPAKTGGPASKHTASARIVPADKSAAAGSTWLPPEADGCPPTHQVKAKVASMIYRLPGMAAYERMTPDRCYATAADAEADGFAKAKR